jgi:hypothetical protein
MSHGDFGTSDHFSWQMKMKQKSIQTISKCWTSENDRENRPRELEVTTKELRLFNKIV